MALDPLTAGFNLVETAIDKIFPDQSDREKAQLAMMKARQQGKLDELKIGMSAIVAEAQSSDPWTSRARPSFLYVMYVLILMAIPMGILSAFHPDMALRISNGMKSYLSAIPSGLWTTFGIGYGGYTVARSKWDKQKK
jgi:hypothetical protein